jgi:hypothetical protein
MDPIRIIMSYRYVTIDAVKFLGVIFIIEMCFPPFFIQAQWKIILVTMCTGGFIGVGFRIFDLGFSLPVEALRVLEKFPPYIPDPGPGLLNQVPFTMRRKVAIHTMDMDSTLVVIMCG